MTDTFTSTGQPWQVHRLSRRLLRLDIREPDDLEPLLEAQEIKDGAWADWEYVTSFLDMAAEAAQYSFDPWANSIRCGGGRYGGTLAPAAGLRLSGRVTLGAGGNLPHETEFAGWSVVGANPQKQPGLSVESWEFLLAREQSRPCSTRRAFRSSPCFGRIGAQSQPMTSDRSFEVTCPTSHASSVCPAVYRRMPKTRSDLATWESSSSPTGPLN